MHIPWQRKRFRDSDVQVPERTERFRFQSHDSKFIERHYSSYGGMKMLPYTVLTAIRRTVWYHILRSANTQAVKGRLQRSSCELTVTETDAEQLWPRVLLVIVKISNPRFRRILAFPSPSNKKGFGFGINSVCLNVGLWICSSLVAERLFAFRIYESIRYR